MQGVTEFRDSAVVVRGRIKTLPGSQWGAGRAYNEIIKRIFDEHGIELPFPHRTIYFGEDREGKAPPLRIEARGKDEEDDQAPGSNPKARSEEHTSDLQSIMRSSYARVCLKKQKRNFASEDPQP